jgi:signal transduction histidine kinase
MTEERRQLIRDSAHRLRSRLTYILLCAHTLKLDLRDKLSSAQSAEFQQLHSVVEETKAVLQTLLKQLEPELNVRPTKNEGAPLSATPTSAGDAAS